MADITISVDDTLEFDTIIRESSEATETINHDNNFISTGIQTHTGVLNPQNTGTHTINVNGQELTVKVTSSNPIPESGISRWTLDDENTSGNEAVDVWGDKNFRLNDPKTGQSGIAGYNDGESYSFDGMDDIVYYPYSRSTLSKWTVTFWLNSDSDNNNKILADDDIGNTSAIDTLEARHESGNIEIYEGDWNTFGTLSTNTDAFISIATDSSIPETTVDISGSRQNKSIGIPLFKNGDSNGGIVFGRGQSGYKAFYSGEIDDIRIFDKRLSTTELDNLRTTGSING